MTAMLGSLLVYTILISEMGLKTVGQSTFSWTASFRRTEFFRPTEAPPPLHKSFNFAMVIGLAVFCLVSAIGIVILVVSLCIRKKVKNVEKEKLVKDKAMKAEMGEATYQETPEGAGRFGTMERLSKMKRSRNPYSMNKLIPPQSDGIPKKFSVLDEEGASNDPYYTIKEKDGDADGYSSLDKINEYCAVRTNNSVTRKGDLDPYSTIGPDTSVLTEVTKDSDGYDHIVKPGGKFVDEIPEKTNENTKEDLVKGDRETTKDSEQDVENVYDTLDEFEVENPYDIAAVVSTDQLDDKHSDEEYELIPDHLVDSGDDEIDINEKISDPKRPKVIIKDNSLYGQSEGKKGPKVTVVENDLYEKSQSSDDKKQKPRVIVKENSLYGKSDKKDNPNVVVKGQNQSRPNKVIVKENSLYGKGPDDSGPNIVAKEGQNESRPKKVIVKENSLYSKGPENKAPKVIVVENDLYVSSQETGENLTNDKNLPTVIVKENSLYGKRVGATGPKVITVENDLYDSSQATKEIGTDKNKPLSVFVKENSIYVKSGDENKPKVSVVENDLYERSPDVKGTYPQETPEGNGLCNKAAKQNGHKEIIIIQAHN